MLRDWGGHHSADDVLAALAEHGEHMSRASVYNVLRDLGARGLIRATGTVHGRAYYEADAPGHHHFICHDCGAIIDVPDHHHPAPPPANLGPGFHIDETQIIYRGRCPNCTARST
jgi:Fe2+ or Zn2+ uptake regulation protein